MKVWSDVRGSLVIETALALMLAFPVIFVVFEVCMFTYTLSVLGDAARTGVRYAIVHGTDSSNCSGPSSGCADSGAANVQSTVQEDAANTLHDMSAMTVSVSYPDASSAPPSRVIIAIHYTYVPYLNLPGLAQAISATAEGRIVY
jgi:Flp pilus assembly protein TadG